MKLRLLAAVAGTLALAGCGADYFFQSASGQLDLIARAKPIDEVIGSTGDVRLKDRLERAREIRAYASATLGLPENGSYTRYTDLGRPFVLWNVFAAPELSLKPREWCFPVAGCVNYRGYFREDEAHAEAVRLRAEGYDVSIGGVPAYSTLGWFDDPILSSFVRYPDLELARLVFHELAHQVAYAKDDTAFNESFAVAVEEEGLRRWMAVNASAAEREAYAASRPRRAEFVRLVLRYRERAAKLYREPLPDEAKRAGKAKLFAELDADYRDLKANGWNGFAGYDRFFAGMNNAHLASVAAYEALVPAFRALLAREGGDLPRFYAAVKGLAALDKPARERELAALTPR